MNRRPIEIETVPQQPKGRLELTWTNKDLALLAEEDGSYQWVRPTDHRVAEVRLLRDAGTVGDAHPDDERAKDNLLIKGDAHCALKGLTGLPEFAEQVLGKVRLIYIDPPFNTGQAFEQYDDNLEHSVWLTMMRDRLEEAKDMLSADGSVWVHLDDVEVGNSRVLLDDVFGRDNFVATIVWEKFGTRDNRTLISTSQDYVTIYAKSRSEFRRNLLPFGEEQLARYSNPDDDPRGDWASLPMHAKAGPGRRQSQFFTVTTPSGRKVDPPKGRCWTYTEERYEELVRDDRIWFGPDGSNVPRVKTFLAEVEGGLVPKTWWSGDEVGDTAKAKDEIVKLFPGVTPFATPKPEAFMERIIHIATDPGDLVLDFFGGSGSTAAVAHKMGRRWITAERERSTIDDFLAPRLKKVVDGDDPGGITEAVDWTGGGGFRVFEVAPSMYEEDEGIVVLADWAVQSELAEATAAQLGFDYEDDPPFSGRKGKVRLAVIDGHCDERAVRELVKALPPKEKVSICATSLDPAAADVLARIDKGSQIRAVPEDVLLAYRTPSAWRVSVARERSDFENAEADKPEPEANSGSSEAAE